MSAPWYECKACRFSAAITDEGVDAMRDHLKSAHRKDPRSIRDKAYVVVRHR